ncbi:hypothetical protein BaRGS_00022000 [Batillaria attramentaria]|uniref:Apple domain-containing protein n=1 Tax=Batillaria attramentaria TaxID=370345 RepID=A0ABD0KHP6_9CAEN
MITLCKIAAALTVMVTASGSFALAATSLDGVRWQNADLVDVTFLDDLLFSVTATSKRDCARLCSTRGYSLTYTFTTSSGECRCHSSYVTSLSTSLPATGTEVYTRYYSCAVSDLQATFLRYPNVAIPSNNLYGGSRPAVQDCLDWCAADTRCLTAEWQGGSGSGYCIAAGVTALDVPENYWDTTGFQDFDLYQRKCA